MRAHDAPAARPLARDTLRQRWLPHPVLTATLTVVWLLLLNDASVGGAVLGFALGVVIPLATRHFWPGRPRIRAYGRAFVYTLLVMGDIVVANLQVARLILFRRPETLATGWVVVPLELTSPEAITVLAGTITMTPGTVSCDLSADGRSLLVHCLDAPDPAATVHEIKTRYERRIKEFLP